MTKRKFPSPKTTADDQIRHIIRQHLNYILSEAEKRVGQRVGDVFLKAAVAIALALIPSTITQAMSAGLISDIVTRVLRSSARKIV
jgi:hypothetical protein